MQSFPGLKKCFQFVAGLSKKILGNIPTNAQPQLSENVSEKSLSQQSKTEQLSVKPIISLGLKQQSPQSKTVQKPKVICFESYMLNKPNTLKSSNIKFLTHNKPSYINQNKHNLLKNTHTNSLIRSNSNGMINKPSNLVDNTNRNQTNQGQKQIPIDKRFQKHHPSTIQFKKTVNQDQDNSVSQQSQQEIILTKKNKKQLKKKQKTPSQTQSLHLDTDQLIFTYQDGDDISSIAAKSETTDQIEPQLLSFITKRGNFYFNKLEEHKNIELPAFNMKKKTVHLQGQTVQVKSPKKKQSQEKKKSSIEVKNKPSPKKRAFQLYPGETFQQFKKRILIQQQPESSQSEEIDDGLDKIIKKQEYDKILHHMNRSMSKMQQEKNKQASILVVQKMVDESENQESRSNHSPKDKLLHEIETYKVWNNAADNPSFKLYFRQV